MKLRNLMLGAGTLALALSFSIQNANATASTAGTERLEKQVKHELNMLPNVNAFDYMEFNVGQDGTVVLNGEVTNPTLKSDAGNVVKRIEGVAQVENRIEVLPVSFFDNGLRVRLFRTIYGDPVLQRYGMGVNKSIRIIVDNGHVTLIGYVDNQADRTIAGMKANGVSGVFSVENRLQVVKN